MTKTARHAGALGGSLLAALLCAPADCSRAHACALISYSFQPDCFAATTAAPCLFDPTHPDFGPQVAVWIETADGSQFVDTLMVTSGVALHGLGNRPGVWNMRSGPRFPYGRREMALPIWAHARGELYPLVVMNAGFDDQFTSHENYSSPESYFCRPMRLAEVVDAITCPSGQFRSDKGVFDGTGQKSYYPPRGDLLDTDGNPCRPLPQYRMGSCDYGDSGQYAFLNDVDVVATATPPYGATFARNWVIPDSLTAGDYALFIEVGKEFDTNDDYAIPSSLAAEDAEYFADYGQDGNLGQPSVLYRLPLKLGPDAVGQAVATSTIAGYSDPTGMTGDVRSPDATISGARGSGTARLMVTDGPGGSGRVHVMVSACESFDCAAASLPLPVSFSATPTSSGTDATLVVHQSADNGNPVLGYDVRYAPVAASSTIDPAAFPSWTPGGTVVAAQPDSTSSLTLTGLIPQTDYAVGIKAQGRCGTSQVSFQRFSTPAIPFAHIEGCFIATAAFGSELAPEVALLRRLRDIAVAQSPVAQALVDAYYRSSPPLANLVARSQSTRAAIRFLLRAAIPGR